MALDTVNDYITQARHLLLDETAPFRYPSTDIVDALNMSLLEACRVRPDLFFKSMRTGFAPAYSSGSTGTSVTMDVRYRVPLLYYIVGLIQLRDDEATQDPRAAALLTKFSQSLLLPQ